MLEHPPIIVCLELGTIHFCEEVWKKELASPSQGYQLLSPNPNGM